MLAARSGKTAGIGSGLHPARKGERVQAVFFGRGDFADFFNQLCFGSFVVFVPLGQAALHEQTGVCVFQVVRNKFFQAFPHE